MSDRVSRKSRPTVGSTLRGFANPNLSGISSATPARPTCTCCPTPVRARPLPATLRPTLASPARSASALAPRARLTLAKPLRQAISALTPGPCSAPALSLRGVPDPVGGKVLPRAVIVKRREDAHEHQGCRPMKVRPASSLFLSSRNHRSFRKGNLTSCKHLA
jgi:hypothetical protein